MKRIFFSRITAILVVVAAIFGILVLPIGAAGGVSATVSHGLSVLSASTDLAVMAPIGNEIAFSEDLIARGMNLSKVNYITVSSLPSAADGELLLGSTRVAVGQTISGENLSYLSFVPAKDDVALHSSFTLTVNGSATPVLCNLYLLDRGNCTPTVSVASSLSLNVSTYREISVFGKLNAYDPDEDTLCFEIVTPPENGSVRLLDAGQGTYVYTPQKGYVGSDRFSYVARDRYGSYSAMATVSLTVNLSGTSITYADMKGSDAYSAAIALTEAGVMSGRQVGNQYYFYPDQGVSRVEFLVMAMNAVGIQSLPACERTEFADDDRIPNAMKSYVATAYELGFIGGTDVDGAICFLPDEELGLAQAAVILNALVEADVAAVVPTFADEAEIPVWAREAIYSLTSVGILSASDGYISASAALTRAEAAKMLAAAMAYSK